MREIDLHGDHYEMGEQHGRQLADLAPLLLRSVRARLAPLEGHPVGDLMVELGRVWATEARPTLDMIAGMASALDIDGDLLLRYAVASYLEDRSRAAPRGEGCSLWAASGPATEGGRPILAKNRDYSLAHLPLQVVARAAPREGFDYLYVTSAGSPGVFSSGMNEAGLAVADSHVPCSDNGPGLPRYSLMMELLEHHTSVGTALEYLQRAPRMGPGNLVMIDATGAMAVFEVGHRRWGVVTAADHLLVATNHFVTPALRDYNVAADEGRADGGSEARHRSLRHLLRARMGRLNGENAREIMASHTRSEASICRHKIGSDSATISNVVFLPAERTMLFGSGTPCRAAYIRYSL